MAKACCVCGDAADKQDNLLFTCKGHGCDVVVHQACYGIVSVPGGQWFCRKCESQERAARVRCELCPKKEGALKRTDSGGWAHVVCALYIPEVTFLNNTKMEPIITSKLPRERFSKACYICEQKGQENQAGYGAVMSCHKSSCRMAFHVTCAQKEGLLCEEEDSRDSGSLIYCGYCFNHYNKMIQKKLKQNLRKHVTTPTSTVAPPLPTITALTTASQSSPHPSSFPTFPSSPHHKDLPVPLPDHLRSQKSHQTGHASHTNQSHRPRNKDRERKDGPQKRISADAPIPPAKRKNRRRKLSSSNESSTSEAPSNASDFVHASGHQPLEQASALVALREGREGGGVERVGGGRGDKVGADNMLHGASMYPKLGDSRVESHSISPVHVLEADRGKDSTASRVGGPPLSLQELLERQWQQTARYILDHAGRQNNAGVMLAHLHELQSENRTMQSRIMELASQREFYIAINTRLRQTLADGTANQLPNGLQPSEGLVQASGLTNPTLQASLSPDFHRSVSSERVSVPSPSPSLPAPSSAGSLSKQDQESLLHAHFLASSLPTSYHPQPPTTNKSQPTPINAHHPVRNTESPGFKHERQMVHMHPHSLRTYEHLSHAGHTHDGQQLGDERTSTGTYSITNAVHTPVPSYDAVSMATSEMDTLTGEHPQSGPGQKH